MNRPAYEELSMVAQTAFAQLMETALSVSHFRSVADLPGSFHAKKIRGSTYWYYQYRDMSGINRQIYVGPESLAVRSLIERKEQSQYPSDHLVRLARSAVALGCHEIPKQHFAVINRLCDSGFFNAGGLLVGTHAFIAYANMLGVRWSSRESSMTMDVDFAHAGKNISLVFSPPRDVNVSSAIESLNMGFLPIMTNNGKSGATWLNPKDPDFRLDFLTAGYRSDNKPEYLPGLGVHLQPLKFMDYALEHVEQTVLIRGGEAVLVNVPNPARYALHKLLIMNERTGAFRVKAGKDQMQSVGLLSLLRVSQPMGIDEALGDMLSRGKGWSSRLSVSVNQLIQNPRFSEIGLWLDERIKEVQAMDGDQVEIRSMDPDSDESEHDSQFNRPSP